jgi:gamma-glutamyltranspeptidase
VFDRTVALLEAGLPDLEPLPRGLLPVEMPAPDMAGHAHAIRITDGGLEAACDPRADGVPVGE